MNGPNVGLELLAKARLVTVGTSQHSINQPEPPQSPHNTKLDPAMAVFTSPAWT